MTKVTVHTEPKQVTPSQEIVQAGNAIQTVTDARGRSICISKMKAIDRLKMFEVIGSGNSENQFYLGYASLAFHVVSIDGNKVNRPATKMQLEHLVQTLDDDGMEAIAAGIEKHFTPKSAEEGDAREPIKNGSTIPS